MVIRRVLLVLTAILFFFNLVALAWVKTAPPAVKYKVTVIADKPDEMSKVKGKLEEEGLTVTVEAGAKMDRMVPDGYKVALQREVELLKPILQDLKHKKFPARLVKDELIVGGVYKTRAQANAMQVKVAQYGFKTTENLKKQSVKVFRINAEVEGEEKLNAIKKDLGELKVPAEDIKAEPLQSS